MKIKCWTNFICRYGGGLHLGIRYQFPINTLIDFKDTQVYRTYQLSFGLLLWEFYVALLIPTKELLE